MSHSEELKITNSYETHTAAFKFSCSVRLHLAWRLIYVKSSVCDNQNTSEILILIAT